MGREECSESCGVQASTRENCPLERPHSHHPGACTGARWESLAIEKRCSKLSEKGKRSKEKAGLCRYNPGVSCLQQDRKELRDSQWQGQRHGGPVKKPPGSYLISTFDMSQSQPPVAVAVVEEKKNPVLTHFQKMSKIKKKINLHFSPYF